MAVGYYYRAVALLVIDRWYGPSEATEVRTKFLLSKYMYTCPNSIARPRASEGQFRRTPVVTKGTWR